MKKINRLFALVLCLSLFSAQSQNCNSSTVSVGQKLKFEVESAPNFVLISMEEGYLTMSAKEKKKYMESYNERLASGALKGSLSSFEMKIHAVKDTLNGKKVTTKFDQGGNSYYASSICINDTIVIVKTEFPTPMVSGNDTTAFMFLGNPVYPLKMKVGDQLPVVVDATIGVPKKFETKAKSFVGSLYAYNSAYRIDFYRQTTYTNAMQFSNVLTQFRTVVGEEQITFDGKPYKAFKIEMSIISQGGMNMQMEDPSVFQKWLKKYLEKKGDQTITCKAFEWFVPELGIINTELYQSNGTLISKTKLMKIE